MRHLQDFRALPTLVGVAALIAPAAFAAARTTPSAGGSQCEPSVSQPGGSIASSRRIVVYGRQAALSGRVEPPSASRRVAVLAQRYDEASARPIAVVETTAEGRWTYLATPGLRTSYRACWVAASLLSPKAIVQVRPRVTLSRRAGGFYTQVMGARSFGGKTIVLQRRSARGWISLKRGRLRRRVERFQVSLPKGTSRLRAFLPRTEAGPGYLAGFSRVLIVRR